MIINILVQLYYTIIQMLKWRPLIISLISFIFILILSLFAVYQSYVSNRISKDNIALSKLKTISQLLTNNFESKMQLANLLAGYVSYKQSITQQEFDLFAAYCIKQNDSKILSIQWAPNGIISHLYPVKVNKQALGLNLFTYKTTKKAALQSLKTKKPHLNGPIPLIQGGIGIIYRVPVFTISQSLDSHQFLGYSAVVAKWKDIVKECKLNIFDQQTIALKVSNDSPERNYFKNGVFYGNQYFFDESCLTDTLTITDKKWILGIKPKQLHIEAFLFNFYIILSLLFSGIISLYIYKNRKYLEKIKISNKLLEDKNAQIQNQIKEKILMMKEIHHRVKNNFQLASSLAKLQSYETDDAQTKAIFQEFSNRINSLALTHEQFLSNDHDVIETSIKEYIIALCDNLVEQIDKNNVKIAVNSVDEKISIKHIILLGIMINELITNSLKYAFHQAEIGHIIINFNKINDLFELVYLDDGIGFKIDVLNNENDSFGIDLIKNITNQLDGHIELYKEGQYSGFKISLNFN